MIFGNFLAAKFATRIRGTEVGLAYNIPFILITGTFPLFSLLIMHIAKVMIFQYAYVFVLPLFVLSRVMIFMKE